MSVLRADRNPIHPSINLTASSTDLIAVRYSYHTYLREEKHERERERKYTVINSKRETKAESSSVLCKNKQIKNAQEKQRDRYTVLNDHRCLIQRRKRQQCLI